MNVTASNAMFMNDPRLGSDTAFWAKVDRSGACWLWTGAVNETGYGRLARGTRPNQRLFSAHRYAYEQLMGPIPAGLDLDHRCHSDAVASGACGGGVTCRHRRCVNPAHLEPVTRRENLLRVLANRPEQMLCKRGHEFTVENTYRRPRGGRTCRACERERQRRAVKGVA